MQDTLWMKINSLVDKYNNRLSEYGVQCFVNRRYRSSSATNRRLGSDSIIEQMDNAVDAFREKKHKNVPNRYKYIVLQVAPIENDIASKNERKHYVFRLSAIERINKGTAPKKKEVKEEKLLSQIEKRLQKLVKKAEKNRSPVWCANSFYDVLRYVVSGKYIKIVRTAKGKSLEFWMWLYFAIVVAVAYVVTMLVW